MAEDQKPQDPRERKKDKFQQLIEQMAKNNELSKSTDDHSRNSRRHLLETKKINQGIKDTLDSMIKDSEASKGDESEREMERMAVFEDIRDSIQEGFSVPPSGGGGSDGPGLMSGAGDLLKGAGIGVGAGAAGIGALLAGGGYLLNQINDMDGEKIKNNIMSILSIGDELVAKEGSATKAFGEAGLLALTLTGLGVGLAAFSIGAGAASVVTKFETPGWPEQIKQNVLTLLSIGDSGGGNLNVLGDAGTLTLALTGLGIGLAAFAVGSAGSSTASAIAKFEGQENWAQSIKDNVLTLLSIGDSGGGNLNVLGDSGTLVLALTGLSVGLGVFALGTAAGASAEALAKFEGQEDWAQRIKDNVLTLLSIGDEAGGNLELLKDSGGVTLALTGLGAGLGAFGAGSGAAAGAQAFYELTKQEGSGSFAEHIKSEVETLLSIGDIQNIGNIDTSMEALGKLGLGLGAFGTGSWIAALGQAGAALLEFFSGKEGPVETALTIADNAGRIDEGAAAFERFADSLKKFENITIDFDAYQFSQNLGRGVKNLEAILLGGDVSIPGLGNDIELRGLTNLGTETETAAMHIERLRNVLSMSNGSQTMSSSSSSSGSNLMSISAENVELKADSVVIPPITTISNVRGGDTRGGDQYTLASPTPSRTTESLSTR